MTYANTLMVVSIAFAILSFVVPTELVAGYNLPQETDVTILRQYWYVGENELIRNGTSGERALTYHDLAISPSETLITFHNHIEIHDERIESTQYFLEFKIEVYERINGNENLIDSRVTGTFAYSPPDEIYHYQTISIDIPYSNIEYHEYNVVSTLTRYEIKSDNSLKYLKSISYGCNALVYEVDDLDEIIGG